MVNSISPSNKDSQVKLTNPQAGKTTAIGKPEQAGEKGTEMVKTSVPIDTLELNTPVEKTYEYSKPGTVKPNTQLIEALRKQSEEALKPLRDMVNELLKQQGFDFETTEKIIKKAIKESTEENTETTEATDGTDQMVTITPEMRAEAQKNISEEGEFGVEKLSDRFVEFAKAISGGDTTKFSLLKESIQQGFEEAAKAFGDELPEISKKTYEATMRKLEDWANGNETKDQVDLTGSPASPSPK